jgi:hypothetical protein
VAFFLWQTILETTTTSKGFLKFGASSPPAQLEFKYTELSHDAEGVANTPVPEPGTMMLLGFGLFGLAVFSKRRLNRNA